MVGKGDTDVTVVTDSSDDELAPEGVACIVIFYGRDVGRRYKLTRTELVIGRSDTASISLDEESVSRLHARIVTEDGVSTLYDMGSTNGTHINDKKIVKAELRDGDLLKVGRTLLKYLSGTNAEQKYHDEIYRLTTIDGLTNAYNKRYFLETLERELPRAQRYDRGLSLVMFDIDYFKQTNDTHGHLAGDHVLRELAGIVAENIRRQDVLARYGGEEFAIILPEIDLEGAAQACEKLRSLVKEHSFAFGEQAIPLTISLGIRALKQGERLLTVEEFISQADAKLYRAKQAGRNRVCY